jgi:hypothetical protein
MLAPMQSPRPQPTTHQPLPRPRPAEPAGAHRHVVTTVQRHTFGIPDVREIPRPAVAGPWEAGW